MNGRAPAKVPPERWPWWRTIGDHPHPVPHRRAERASLARFLSRVRWRHRQRDAEPWTDLGGEG